MLHASSVIFSGIGFIRTFSGDIATVVRLHADECALKIVYLASMGAAKKWMMPISNWKPALNQFTVLSISGCIDSYNCKILKIRWQRLVFD